MRVGALKRQTSQRQTNRYGRIPPDFLFRAISRPPKKIGATSAGQWPDNTRLIITTLIIIIIIIMKKVLMPSMLPVPNRCQYMLLVSLTHTNNSFFTSGNTDILVLMCDTFVHGTACGICQIDVHRCLDVICQLWSFDTLTCMMYHRAVDHNSAGLGLLPVHGIGTCWQLCSFAE